MELQFQKIQQKGETLESFFSFKTGGKKGL